MARKRTRKPKLPRLFENSTSLIAVVDHEYEVLFANSACLQWLDISAESLLGAQLNFGPQSELALSAASGICPDPSCFDHKSPAQKTGHIFADRHGTRLWKSASFHRIAGADRQPCIVMIADGPDLQQPNDRVKPTAHTRLQRFFAKLSEQDRIQLTHEPLVGQSHAAARLRRQIEAVANNQSDCIIVGPAGSGREHIARLIFERRNLSNTNLIPIHCTIADSQFLQNSIKEWVIEQRESQTKDWLLLLDVDKMNAESQIELFGYTQLPDFPLRIIATSTADLFQLATEEKFHVGLANHLCVQVIAAPGLAERKSDIPLLCQYFIESSNNHNTHQISETSEAVLDLFYEYHWPGNNDELKRVMLEACSLCDKPTILPEHLSDKFKHSITAARIGYHQAEKIKLDQYLGEIECELIGRALDQAENNKTKAADLLGISRAKLLSRAAALGLIESERKNGWSSRPN